MSKKSRKVFIKNEPKFQIQPNVNKKTLIIGDEPTGKITPIESFINDRVSSAVKQYIFPLKLLMDQRHHQFENFKANLMALQTLLGNLKIIDKQALMNEYNKIVTEVIGVVDESGRMSGFARIEIYNLEVTL